MTLQELSLCYEAAAVPLRARLKFLRQAVAASNDADEIWHLKRRIAELTQPESSDTETIDGRVYRIGQTAE